MRLFLFVPFTLMSCLYAHVCTHVTILCVTFTLMSSLCAPVYYYIILHM